MIISLLTPTELSQLIEEATMKGYIKGYNDRHYELEKELSQAVEVREIAAQYNIHPHTLYKKVNKRHIPKLKLKPMVIERRYVNELLKA